MTTLVEVAKYIEGTILKEHQEELGLNDVLYGDQAPAGSRIACVETGTKQNEIDGASMPRRVMRTYTVYILIYHNDVKFPSQNREDNDKQAEAVENLIHADKKLGGLINQTCLVTSVEAGYAARGSTIFQTSRLTVQATSLEMLPS
jgi:hypothetical protein